jgi:hypothetical protein
MFMMLKNGGRIRAARARARYGTSSFRRRRLLTDRAESLYSRQSEFHPSAYGI